MTWEEYAKLILGNKKVAELKKEYNLCTKKYTYGKYKKLLGYRVRIIKNNGLSQYNKLVREIGYVYDFEFENFDKPIIVHFPKIKKEYCFAIDELEEI